MNDELRVVYKIEASQDQELDAALKACLKQHGWHWYGSGFNYNTGERDLAFDREEVADVSESGAAVIPVPNCGDLEELIWGDGYGGD